MITLISTSEAVDDGYDFVTCSSTGLCFFLFSPAATLEALVSGKWWLVMHAYVVICESKRRVLKDGLVLQKKKEEKSRCRGR